MKSLLIVQNLRYDQYKRDGVIGKLQKTGFVAEETFAPGSFGSWSHITAAGSLLFFYNQGTREAAVATTAPQSFKFVKMDFPGLSENASLSSAVMNEMVPHHQAVVVTSSHFATVTTYAPGSFSNWTHVVASGAYLFFYNQHDGSACISELVNEPLTTAKDMVLGAKVSLRTHQNLNAGSAGQWTHIVGAAPYLLFYNQANGAGQIAKVNHSGLHIVSKMGSGSFGQWTHILIGEHIVKATLKPNPIIGQSGTLEPNGASVLFYDAQRGVGALGQLCDDTFKTVKSFGGGEFGRWTNISGTAVTADPLAQYTLFRSPSGLKLMDYQGGSTELVIPTDKLTPDQQAEILDQITAKLLDFLVENRDEAKDGKLSASDIGGVIYGAAGALIADVLIPGLGETILGEILKKGSEQAGRYYGAAVDTLIDTIKRLDDVQIADIVGTLATVHIIALYFPWMPVTGTDGWSFTVEVGKKLGQSTVDAINTIGSIVKDVTGAAIKLAGDAVDVAKGIWDSISIF